MRVVVAGAGVIGLWCARELAADGAEVVVVGPSYQVAVSTPASAGWVVPVLSHPLSAPGVLRDAARQVVRRRAAFSLHGMSPELGRWLWQLLRAGTADRFEHGLRATLGLAASCRPGYQALRDQGLDIELHEDGLLMVARSAEGLHHARHLVEAAAAASYDGRSDYLDPSGLAELEPALAQGLAGGVHARDELHLHPGKLLDALRADAVVRGVTMLDGMVETVTRAAGGRWTVATSEGPIAADKVVLAAGYWSGRIAASIGVRLPLQSAAGVSITAVGPNPPRLPLKLVEANVAVTPFADGVRLAGRFTLGPPAETVSPRQVRRVVEAAAPYLRSWRPVTVSATHVGLRPATPDSLPLIGELPGRRGILAATGHGMLGLTLAPGTAAEIAHQVSTGEPTTAGRAFSPSRYLGRPSNAPRTTPTHA